MASAKVMTAATVMSDIVQNHTTMDRMVPVRDISRSVALEDPRCEATILWRRPRHESPCNAGTSWVSSNSCSHAESVNSLSRCDASECRLATATNSDNVAAMILPVCVVCAPSEIVKRNASPVRTIVGICHSRVSHC